MAFATPHASESRGKQIVTVGTRKKQIVTVDNFFGSQNSRRALSSIPWLTSLITPKFRAAFNNRTALSLRSNFEYLLGNKFIGDCDITVEKTVERAEIAGNWFDRTRVIFEKNDSACNCCLAHKQWH